MLNTLYGYVIIGIAILFLGGGLYFNFQLEKREEERKENFLRQCFNQNYDYKIDNPKGVINGCEKLYNKENGDF